MGGKLGAGSTTEYCNSTPLVLPLSLFLTQRELLSNLVTFLRSNGSYMPMVSIRLSSRQSLLEMSGSGTIGGVMRESSRSRIAVLATQEGKGEGKGGGEGEGEGESECRCA